MARGINLEFESGEESLQVRHFTAFERMSAPFEISVAALSPRTDIDLEALVGKGAALSVRGVVPRVWTGICRDFGQVQAEGSQVGRSTYVFTIVPALWLLTQRRGNRIFQHLSIPDIVEKILKEWNIEFDSSKVARGEHPKLEYCLQYGESDFRFVSRLLERAGIAYYFDEAVSGDKAKSRLFLCDKPQLNDSRGAIRWVDKPNPESREEFVTNVVLAEGVVPGQYNFRDFDFRRPDFQLFGKASPAPSPEDQYETYRYLPGGSLVEVDSAPDATPVADKKSKARHDDKQVAPARATVGQEAQRALKRYVEYRTNVLTLHPGIVFSIDRHPHNQLTKDTGLLAVSAETHCDASTGEWLVSGQAVYAASPYRPPHVTPNAKIPGLQSAVVVGPPGQEIATDEFGRVRVKFHWDREGAYDDNATCWLRPSQHWAGAGWGTELVPRIGHEVLVDFLDGDPDQPVIVGRLYNATARQPYLLPAGMTQSTWKSDTTPHTDNAFNEIMFEDKVGQELVFVQAQRDLRKLVKQHETERVGNDRTHIIGKSRLSVIAAEDAFQVGEQRLVKMIKAKDLKILRMEEPNISPKETFYEVRDKKIVLTTSGATITLDGPKIAVEAKTGIRLSAKGKILIQGGPAVYLNEKPGQVTTPKADKEVKDAVPKPTGRVLASILELLASKKKAETLARKEQDIEIVPKSERDAILSKACSTPDKPVDVLVPVDRAAVHARVEEARHKINERIGDVNVGNWFERRAAKKWENSAKTAQDLHEDAKAVEPMLRDIVATAAKNGGGEANFGPGGKHAIKAYEKLVDKHEKRGFAYQDMSDAVRGTVIVNKPEDVKKAVGALKDKVEAEGGKLIVDNKFAKKRTDGYGAVHADLFLPVKDAQGQPVLDAKGKPRMIKSEVQVHLKSLHDGSSGSIKERSHVIYERTRDKSAGLNEADIQRADSASELIWLPGLEEHTR